MSRSVAAEQHFKVADMVRGYSSISIALSLKKICRARCGMQRFFRKGQCADAE
jgi:hypothetical protein